MDKILPCPRCKSKYVGIFQDGDWWMIHCEPVECGLTSARFKYKNDAINWWNISNGKKDEIKQQAHYTQHKIQPVVFIGENRLDFLAGNVIKYVSRYNLKNGVEDLEKARHYLDMLIQREKGEEIKP